MDDFDERGNTTASSMVSTDAPIGEVVIHQGQYDALTVTRLFKEW